MEFFREDNKKFLDRICNTIKNAIKYNLKIVTLCDITYDGITKFRVNIYKKDYKEALISLLRLYEKAEEYEKCSMVKKLMKKIK
jgi:hypothetical protein